MSDREERVERRLTAILAADVVGYSRLMSTARARYACGVEGEPVLLRYPVAEAISTRGRKWNTR